MEAVLDELTLVEGPEYGVGLRIQELAKALRALDQLGAARVVRTVSNAATRSVSGGSGLGRWCFHPTVDKDAGRLVALRISSQPYIDGDDGLMLGAEAGKALECTVGGEKAVGLGYCYLTDGFPVGLSGSLFVSACDRALSLYCLAATEEWSKDVVVRLILTAADVESDKAGISSRIDSSIRTGQGILQSAADVFPSLRFGQTAVDQLTALSGTELHFSSIIRHLRAFQAEALNSAGSGHFEPEISWSVESQATLIHGRYGPLRDFPWPMGCGKGRWSKHSKIGPNAIRIYFEPKFDGPRTEVCVGYVGPHLPTADHNS